MKKFLVVLLVLISACSFAQTRNLAGELNTVGIDSDANEVSLPAASREVITDSLTTGYIGSQTLVADVTPSKIGTLTTGTRVIQLQWQSDGAVGPVYFGGPAVTTATGISIPATATLEIKVATTTPALYFITTATASVRILHLK